MLSFPSAVRIYFCVMPVDMRCSFDSLAELVRQYFQTEPQSGHLFVFRNKREDSLKVLYWDRDGYALWYKRLGATCKGAHMNGRKLPRDALLPILT